MLEERQLLGAYLIQQGLIRQDQLDTALKESKKARLKLGKMLVRLGFVSENDIAKALSEQLGFPYVDLGTYHVEQESLELVSAEVAARLEVIPMFILGDSMSVAMSNPLDVAAIDEVTQCSHGLRIKPYVATGVGIKAAIARFYPAGDLSQPYPSFEGTQSESPNISGEDRSLEDEAEQQPVIQLVNHMIEEAVAMNVSDIHLEPHEKSFFCRFRVDGILTERPNLPFELRRAVISRIKIMAGMNIAQNRLPQDGRVRLRDGLEDVDLRVATFPTMFGEHVTIRILDKAKGILSLDQLGFQEDMLLSFQEMIHHPHGMILVTGPTGSGKSTTLYGVLNTINDLKKNIVTLEDPIEYTIPRVNQSQVNIKAGLSFATGLRSIVRNDPDVIMIGEIRDKDTADIAIHSALTGHLVFSTLHTNDAPSAAMRLINLGIEPYLVASSLMGILAQRLIRKLCPHCKESYIASPQEMRSCSPSQEIPPERVTCFRPKGCSKCQGTGFQGRSSIFELLIPDAFIKEQILQKATSQQIKISAQKLGMRTLRDDGFEKVRQGMTSISEIVRVTE